MLTKLLAFFPIFKYKISGQSMLPTLQPGQNVLVNKLSRITIRDIVATKDPRDGKILIKRITEIKNGKYYLLGDNSKESTDSRHFGWIGKKDIIGRVIYPTSEKRKAKSVKPNLKN